MTEPADQFWAEHLGIEPADWRKPGVSIRSHVGLKGYRGAWCFQRLGHTVVSAPTGWLPHLRSLWEGADRELLMQESFLRTLFGADFERLIGPTFHGALDPGRFRPLAASNVRLLGRDEDDLVEAFRVECDPGDWRDSGLSQVTDYATACLGSGQILAVAGYRARTPHVGDLCVLTHPAQRGRGYGLATTSAVVERALRDAKVLLYQTLRSNVGAVRIATGLGFDDYATHVAIRLSADEPSNSRQQPTTGSLRSPRGG